MEYIFNDSVVFKETEGLRYKHQDQVAIPMSILQAGVLAELVKAHGKPVHRDELLEHVWEKNGYLASNNSLNHNIGFLRKSLKDCGINDAIITVHRVGFKLEKMVDVKVYRQEVDLYENTENNNVGDKIHANETIAHPPTRLLLNKPWRRFRQTMLKNRSPLFLYIGGGVLLAFLLVLAVFNFLKPTGESPSYVSTVAGCKIYSVYQIDNGQKDKYRRYAEYFLRSQEKRCTLDDMLLMHVQDEQGSGETREGNNRAFFAICNFNKETSDFCKSVYSYSMVLP
ncbi:winged helix-turn-helix domain-containing protein [Serratia aquatilis]|uniref:Transcriptional regulator n=1 Tax=Serratia aquatilis TaxID=1737515 RepID=A0ABV6EBC4_9GAMM